VAATTWRIAASEFDQLLLDVPLDLDLVWSRRLGSVVKGCFQPFGDEALPQALDRSQTDTQSRDDLGVRTRITVFFIGQE
jgi:hypothetical protein